ncbi:hypothetical protein ACIQCF_39130 [Streptomyces sp. NPDC088353]
MTVVAVYAWWSERSGAERVRGGGAVGVDHGHRGAVAGQGELLQP